MELEMEMEISRCRVHETIKFFKCVITMTTVQLKTDVLFLPI